MKFRRNLNNDIVSAQEYHLLIFSYFHDLSSIAKFTSVHHIKFHFRLKDI